MGPHVAWVFVALLLGLCIGWLTYSRHRARAIDALVWIVIGLLIVSPVLLPDLSAAATPLGTLLALFYFVGCPIGWWLRHDAWIVRSEAERHAEGYVFRGGLRAEATGWWPVHQRRDGASAASRARPAAASSAPTLTDAAPILPATASQPTAEAAVASEAIAAQTPPPSALPSPPPTEERPKASDDTPLAAASVTRAAFAATPSPVASSPGAKEKSGLATLAAASTESQASGASSSPASQAEVAAPTATASTDATATDTAPTATPAVSDPPASPPVPDQDKHSGVRPPGFVTARGDKPDDLQWIRGIGPQNEERLHRLGIWHFDQIGAWTTDEVRWVGSYLAFPGRIDRERWVEQARDIAAGAITPKATARRPVRPRP